MTNKGRLALVGIFLLATTAIMVGCGKSEPEPTKGGGTYYEGPMKPKSVGGN